MKSRSAKVTKALHGSRFDVAAASAFSDLSRKKIKSILDAGGAYLNKKRISIAKFIVCEGDKLELFWDESNLNVKITNDLILFENDQFFVINKPPCIATQATLSSSTDTIFHALNKFHSNRFKLNEMHMVHRLDKDTSGILIVAKNKSFQRKMEDLFRDKKVEKTYHALCFHKPPQNEGSICFPIAKDNSRQNTYFAIMSNRGATVSSRGAAVSSRGAAVSSRGLTAGSSNLKDAKQAQTDYKVEKIFKEDCSHLICFPKTGRTHQIRVHLSAIGCPVLGDKSYAKNIYGHPHLHLAARHMLHAQGISFEINGEKFKFEAALPEDFLSAIRTLEKV